VGEPAGQPQRRCAACRTRRPKAELLRFARVAGDDGGSTVEIDRHQRAQGRGAYTCWNETCIGRGLTKGGIARTLRIAIRQDEAERLSARAVEYLREHTMLGALPSAQRPTGTPSSGISPGEES